MRKTKGPRAAGTQNLLDVVRANGTKESLLYFGSCLRELATPESEADPVMRTELVKFSVHVYAVGRATEADKVPSSDETLALTRAFQNHGARTCVRAVAGVLEERPNDKQAQGQAALLRKAVARFERAYALTLEREAAQDEDGSE